MRNPPLILPKISPPEAQARLSDPGPGAAGAAPDGREPPAPAQALGSVRRIRWIASLTLPPAKLPLVAVSRSASSG